MKKEIGSEIHFDQTSFDRELRAWQSVLPAVLPVIEKYNQLGIGAFDNETFEAFKAGNHRTTEKAHEALKEDFKNFRLQHLYEQSKLKLDEQLEVLKQDWAIVLEKHNLHSISGGYPVHMIWQDVSYSNGAFQFDEVAIRQRHTTRIENHGQLEMYELMENVKSSRDALCSFLKNNQISMYGRSITSVKGDGFLIELPDNSLRINHAALSVLK